MSERSYIFYIFYIRMTHFYNIFIILFFPSVATVEIDSELLSFNAKVWSKVLDDRADTATDDDIRALGRKQKVEFSNGVEDLTDESIPWPGGEIPYTIDDIKFDQTFLMEFYSALKEFHSKTCVKFRPKQKGDQYFVKIIKGDGCWSYVGLQPELRGIGQEVSLGDECWRKGIIIHEFTHVLGFFHEHSRFDRDAYITLNHPNIQKNRIRQFDKRPKEKVDDFGTYDYHSILHYEATAFAVDKSQPTIVPKLNHAKFGDMGQRRKLSDGDVIKINAFYNCSMPNYKTVIPNRKDVKEEFAKLEAIDFKPPYEIKSDGVKTFKSYNQIKTPRGMPFSSLEDFRIRTGRRVPPPGLSFSFTSSAEKLRDQNDFAAFKQYPILNEFTGNGVDKNIECPTKAAGNCMDRMDNCYELAVSGQCEKKPGYMNRMCRRSCCNCNEKKCSDTTDSLKFNTLCVPRNSHGSVCSIAASRQNALDYCPLTCKICQI